MNEILGIVIPMLMSGADIMSIVRALGGERGSASMDGLERMMRTSLYNARRAHPLVQNQATIDMAAETLVDRLGINPYSGLGQGLSSLMGHLYHFAPDTIGTILGMPNGGQFFSTVANGASGINQASGGGPVDIFNPYSVMAAHEKSRNLARKMYDFGVRKSGGYDVSYSHGLNMGEMGMVAQRILSSDLPYVDEDGRRLDLSTNADGSPVSRQDAEKFSKNLKNLGSKFNEAASMLAKMTGSIEEALSFMDKISGGNFLGGSAEHAKSVAEKARNFATAIRVTSAVSGTSPMEAYANMQGLMQVMAAGSGASPYIANASGYTSMMSGMAMAATAAYGMWTATNPKATQEQKAQALLAYNGITSRYANSNGAALAAAVADNRALFSEEELNAIETEFRNGNPNAVVNMVKSRIGRENYEAYMTDPGMQIAARYRIGNDDKSQEIVNRIDRAGMAGAMSQAETEGNRRLVRRAMSDLDTDLAARTGRGRSSFSKERDDAVLSVLRKMAVEYEASPEAAEEMSERELRDFLGSRDGMDAKRLERIVNTSRIEAAEAQIDSLAMNDAEDAEARRVLKGKLDVGKWSDAAKKEFETMIDRGDDLDVVMDSFTKLMKPKEAEDLRREVTGGRLTARQVNNAKERLSELKDSQRVDYSVRERMARLKNNALRDNVADAGTLKGIVAREGFGEFADKYALERFAGAVFDMSNSGQVSVQGDDKDLTRTYEAAARKMVDGIIGEDLGKMKGKQLDGLKDEIAKRIVSAVRGGSSVQGAFASVMESLEDKYADKIGDKGMDRVDELVSDARNPDSRLNEQKLNRHVLLSNAQDMIASTSAEASNKLKAAADEIGRSGARDDLSTMSSFSGKIKELGGSGVLPTAYDDEKVSKTFSEAARRMVSGVVGTRLGDLEGEGLDELVTKLSGKMLGGMKEGKGGEKYFDKAFARALTELTDEELESLGKKGREQVEDWKKKATEGNIEGLSGNDFIGNVVGVVDEGNKEGRVAAVERMDKLLKGEFDNLTDIQASDEFLKSARSAGVFSGTDEDFAAIKGKSIRQFLSDNLGAYGLSETAIEEIGKSVESDKSGDYGKSMQTAMADYAKKSGNKKLESLAEALGRRNDVGTSVLGNMFKQMMPEGDRRPGFAAMSQAGAPELAMLIMAASATGADLGEVFMNMYAPDLLSYADSTAANAQMNRIPNALQSGMGGFAKAAVDDTKKSMVELGKALKKGNISDQDIKNAFSKEGDKEAMSKVDKALEGQFSGEDLKKKKNLLRTLNEGFKIGNEDALGIVMKGESAIEEIGKSRSSRKEILDITREANKKDSESFKMLDAIGNFTRDLASFFNEHTINVAVSGKVDVSGSRVNMSLL